VHVGGSGAQGTAPQPGVLVGPQLGPQKGFKQPIQQGSKQLIPGMHTPTTQSTIQLTIGTQTTQLIIYSVIRYVVSKRLAPILSNIGLKSINGFTCKNILEGFLFLISSTDHLINFIPNMPFL